VSKSAKKSSSTGFFIDRISWRDHPSAAGVAFGRRSGTFGPLFTNDRLHHREWRTIMQTMERDPAFIAQQVKFIRKMYRLTQENLAEAAGLTTRTIEKVESGRHRPEEQTLRSIARAVKIEVRYFDKPTPEQEAQQRADMERALRKIVMVPTNPIRCASDFLAAFGHRHAFRFDTSQVQSDDALEVAASLVDWIKDLNDGWDDCSASEQLECARSCVELSIQLEALGYLCHMGHHKQVLREKQRPDLVLEVGLLSVQKKADGEGTRYALIELEGRWEKVNDDSVPLIENRRLRGYEKQIRRVGSSVFARPNNARPHGKGGLSRPNGRDRPLPTLPPTEI
jgi:transcriptional regulator with XRE-family HTH domain